MIHEPPPVQRALMDSEKHFTDNAGCLMIVGFGLDDGSWHLGYTLSSARQANPAAGALSCPLTTFA